MKTRLGYTPAKEPASILGYISTDEHGNTAYQRTGKRDVPDFDWLVGDEYATPVVPKQAECAIRRNKQGQLYCDYDLGQD